MYQLRYEELDKPHQQKIYLRQLNPQQSRTAFRSSCLLTTSEEDSTSHRGLELWFCPVTSLPEGFCTESEWLLSPQKWIPKGACHSSLQHVLKRMRKAIKVGINTNYIWELVKQDILHMEMSRWKTCLPKINLFSWCLLFLLGCVNPLKNEGGTKNSKHKKIMQKKCLLFFVPSFKFSIPKQKF